jgi:hypothetical protein
MPRRYRKSSLNYASTPTYPLDSTAPRSYSIGRTIEIRFRRVKGYNRFKFDRAHSLMLPAENTPIRFLS